MAPGGMDETVDIVGRDGAVLQGPKLKKNCLVALKAPPWEFGGCSESAARYDEVYAVEFGFRQSRRRPRGMLLGADYPSTLAGGGG